MCQNPVFAFLYFIIVLQGSHITWYLGAMPAPKTPGPPFLQKKGGERLPGRPRSPFAAMSALGKSFLEALHASSEGFFRWRGFPRGAAKGLFFLVALPRDRGSFEGGRTSTVPRVVRPPLNALLVKAFSHKKPCAGVGARAPTNQFQDGILLGC